MNPLAEGADKNVESAAAKCEYLGCTKIATTMTKGRVCEGKFETYHVCEDHVGQLDYITITGKSLRR